MEPNAKQKRDVWTALVLLGIAALYLFNTFQFSPGGAPGLPNARTFPFLLTGTLTILALALLWQSRSPSATPSSALTEEDGDDALLLEEPSRLRLGLLVLILLGYIVILPYAGFLIATPLLGLLMQIVIFGSGWVRSIIATIALTALSYWLFAGLLNVPLP